MQLTNKINSKEKGKLVMNMLALRAKGDLVNEGGVVYRTSAFMNIITLNYFVSFIPLLQINLF